MAEIIAGEAPAALCGFQAALAVAWVYTRNKTFYGRGIPGVADSFIANHFQRFPDPTSGAVFLFSDNDLQQKNVRRLIAKYHARETAVFYCRGGMKLYAFGTEGGGDYVEYIAPRGDMGEIAVRQRHRRTGGVDGVDGWGMVHGAGRRSIDPD